jgi:carbonic anhydrase
MAAENLSWQDALKKLEEGNENFVADKLDGQLNDSSRRSQLTSGQQPYAIILSCADSRVVPELAFDKGLGELFVVRVAGNVSNASSIASIEYAVAHLGVNLIVVMGHESCGAVTAAIQDVKESPSLNHLLDQIKPAVSSAGSTDVNTVVKKNAVLNADKLISDSEIIKSKVDSGSLKILSAFYNLGSGKVDIL